MTKDLKYIALESPASLSRLDEATACPPLPAFDPAPFKAASRKLFLTAIPEGESAKIAWLNGYWLAADASGFVSSVDGELDKPNDITDRLHPTMEFSAEAAANLCKKDILYVLYGICGPEGFRISDVRKAPLKELLKAMQDKSRPAPGKLSDMTNVSITASVFGFKCETPLGTLRSASLPDDPEAAKEFVINKTEYKGDIRISTYDRSIAQIIAR